QNITMTTGKRCESAGTLLKAHQAAAIPYLHDKHINELVDRCLFEHCLILAEIDNTVTSMPGKTAYCGASRPAVGCHHSAANHVSL
ncbi:MAG: hypothetical protein R3188_02830, partial [Acidiferrobacterales bacterium]|nr:hypothetical protein [Acidiferrobacterales bacterium]